LYKVSICHPPVWLRRRYSWTDRYIKGNCSPFRQEGTPHPRCCGIAGSGYRHYPQTDWSRQGALIKIWLHERV